MVHIEHPDITAALITGYPTFQAAENQDSQENRSDFINENSELLIKWLRLGYPDILDEFIEMHRSDYQMWLN